MNIIDKATQDTILKTIKTLATSDGVLDLEKARLMLIGVYVALGSQTPPHWITNIKAFAVTKLFAK